MVMRHVFTKIIVWYTMKIVHETAVQILMHVNTGVYELVVAC